MSFAQLDALCLELHAIDHALSMLGVDEAVNMPAGGGEARAASLATLSGLRHEKASAPHIAEWIAAAEVEDLSPARHIALKEFKRDYVSLTCLPSEFVRRKTATNLATEQAWRTQRANHDWAGFLPAFAKNVEIAREEAGLRAAATGLAPYDALMDQFDPGNRQAELTPVFEALKSFLKGFVPQAMTAQDGRRKMEPLRPLNGPFPVEHQKALGLAAMAAIGFDFEHGRLDVSHHPFCGGVPTDVRMTTRYRTDEFLSSFMGVLHETGHALYEQGLPKELAHWPSTNARGMGMHESQSMFVELQLARSEEFWAWALPLARTHIGSALDGFTPRDVLAHINTVKPGYIRVDADEVTYPLHIALRYEFERDLISGALSPKDVPEAWDAKMRDYLGLSTIDNPADGPMQDVHWPAGLFGYFPSYALGAMMAAQQWAAMEKQLPNVREEIARGQFASVNQWRAENIWQKASTASTPEILQAATGEKLNPAHFITHLEKRYG